MKTKPTDILCSCAGCGATLHGSNNSLTTKGRLIAEGIYRVAGRIHDRPYCSTCLNVPKKTSRMPDTAMSPDIRYHGSRSNGEW